MSLSGGCRCGFLQYRVEAELAPVVHCHCGFCRHVHGASFTTVGFLSARAFAWLPSSGEPSKFVTPLGNHRHFCGRCASPLYNLAPGVGLACVIVPSLAEPSRAMPWAHVNTESMAPWLEIRDRLPRFPAWPSAEELARLAREHGATLPEELGRVVA
jgi:ADP-ribosyl-[dinitrogen reductase] hydrolase